MHICIYASKNIQRPNSLANVAVNLANVVDVAKCSHKRIIALSEKEVTECLSEYL